MLIVDKTKSDIRLLVTVSENTTASSPSYVMKIMSPFSNTSHTINLPGNTSSYPTRYDEFIVGVSLFSDITVGKYNYTIEEATDGVVESGVLIVTDNIPDEFESITPEASEDDFLVYNPD